MMSTATIRILDPVGQPKQRDTGVTARPATLSGKVLGLLSNGWRSFDLIAERYASVAQGRHEVRDVLMRQNPSAASATPKQSMEELIQGSDAIVVGVGH